MALLWACAEDLPEPDAPPTADSKLVAKDLGDGSFELTLDASHQTDWLYLALTDRSLKAPAAPLDSTEWDLAFRRFHVRVNGGVSGTKGVEVATLTGTAFDAVTQAPDSGYRMDTAKGEGGEAPPDFVNAVDANLAFNLPNEESESGWYHYDPVAHTLSPAEVVYVVRVGAQHHKLRFLAYYDSAGTPGFVKIQIAPVDPPTGPARRIEAATGWAYLNLAGNLPTVADPSASTAWDLGFNHTQLASNGGTSGPGRAGVMQVDLPFAQVTSAGTVGYEPDTLLPIPGPPGSGTFSGNPVLLDWYDYDPIHHVATPKDQVYLVRGATGGYAKFRITGYESGNFEVEIVGVPRGQETRTLEIDASAGWTYWSLSLGRVVTSSLSTEWDLALSRTNLRTNSGTSGPGAGGAWVSTETSLDAVTQAPTDGYQVDALVPLPGPPGSGEISANPVLAGWYNYDPVTHAVSPKPTVFVVRTAQGDYAKLQVEGYSGGRYTLRYAYAGPASAQF
ncbi:MAG: hypothetical protein IPG45_02540 [Deltaproteobacteria bacterium]|nr:hypothetical protein [Deltaproteobacteria bacterium]